MKRRSPNPYVLRLVARDGRLVNSEKNLTAARTCDPSSVTRHLDLQDHPADSLSNRMLSAPTLIDVACAFWALGIILAFGCGYAIVISGLLPRLWYGLLCYLKN